jgi:superfamily II DNA or RNA helicase
VGEWGVSDVRVYKKDAVSWTVDAEPSILMELVDFFTFPVPGAQFTPAYKSKMWDGKYRLFNAFSKELPFGLYRYLEEFCERNKYSITFDDEPYTVDADDETIDTFFQSLPVTSQGKEISARDYQLSAAKHAIQKQRGILLSPTSSGKSLILYLMLRWHQQHKRKVLIIVPTTSLVKQMYGDFLDYSETDSSWDATSSVETISAGKPKNVASPIVISTWQSIHRQPEAYFSQFDVIMGDECHTYTSKSLTTIMNKAKNTYFRVGTTGTLDGSKTHMLVLTGLFGPVKNVITTKQLMDAGKIAELKITCLQLGYEDSERKAMKTMNYQQEIDWLVTHPKRNKFIANLALKQTGNTLVLFQYVEKHGKVLFDLLQEKKTDDRKVFFIHGKVDADIRENVRKIVEQEANAIIVASNGVFSTGTNLRNLHTIIFSSPSKSRIRNLQSIGRGLRRSDTKTSCKLFDIGDDLAWKNYKNFTLRHMIERIKIYSTEQFDYTVINVQLTK